MESSQRFLPIWIKDGACAAQALGHSSVQSGQKILQTFRKLVDAMK